MIVAIKEFMLKTETKDERQKTKEKSNFRTQSPGAKG